MNEFHHQAVTLYFKRKIKQIPPFGSLNLFKGLNKNSIPPSGCLNLFKNSKERLEKPKVITNRGQKSSSLPIHVKCEKRERVNASKAVSTLEHSGGLRLEWTSHLQLLPLCPSQDSEDFQMNKRTGIPTKTFSFHNKETKESKPFGGRYLELVPKS